MPLYGCDRCGFTSAAFRPDAVASHRLEYPDCDGAMRIMFRSTDRHRGGYDARDLASPAPARHSQARAATTNSRRALLVSERLDAGGMLRLILLGDLDVAGAEALNARLAELKTAGRPVRLDLSRLAFIDSSGIQALIVTLTDARSTGWQLEVAPEVSPSVRRAAEIIGIARILWPADPEPNPSNAPSSRWSWPSQKTPRSWPGRSVRLRPD